MTPLTRLIMLGLDLARELHDGQFRRDGVTPYYGHVLACCHKLREDDEPDHICCLGAVHDVLEERPDITIQHLRERGLPDSVLNPLVLLTHRKEVPYSDYLDALSRDEAARKVKIKDMICNLADRPTQNQIRKYASGLLFLLDAAI